MEKFRYAIDFWTEVTQATTNSLSQLAATKLIQQSTKKQSGNYDTRKQTNV
jgi:hypothetical protein